MDARIATSDTQYVPAISDYGVIGNLETVALVAQNGAIEFFSYPHFDSPSIFCAMLDRERGGAFTVASDVSDRGEQRYEDDTNVLVTTFADGRRTLTVTDFMPMGEAAKTNQLIRIVEVRGGAATVRATCRPAFDYAREPAVAQQEGARVATLMDRATDNSLRLVATHEVRAHADSATVDARLEDGERLILNLVCDNADDDLLTSDAVEEALAQTRAGWRDFAARAQYDGRHRAAVVRSALTLKLMFSRSHGSIVAAPTFGLPEAIGGSRNWDYRYCWVRDSAFTVYAMLRLGYTDEAEHYRCFIRDRLEECENGALQLMYRLDGTTAGLEESVLDHLSGYRGSTPVRIGNAANEQTQLDIYGEVIDALYLSAKHLSGVSDEGWEAMARVVDYVCDNWGRPGSGLWEMRGPPRRFLDAHVMCWVAVDRALRLADKTGRTAPQHWRPTAEAIAEAVHEHFWNEEIGAFVQTEGAKNLDAVALLMPLVKFLPTTDPRFASTLRAIGERLAKGCLLMRYEADDDLEGLEGPAEGYFVTCSFWYIECLARSGKVDEAARLFEEMLSHASPLGLLSEELSGDGTHLGNTPQALSHLSLISAAIALDRAQKNGGEPF